MILFNDYKYTQPSLLRNHTENQAELGYLSWTQLKPELNGGARCGLSLEQHTPNY